jgi:hypothetical protein
MSSQLNDAEQALSDCMFTQIAFCLSGVVVGTGIGLAKKPATVLPMATAGVAGTALDWAYAKHVKCVKEQALVDSLRK